MCKKICTVRLNSIKVIALLLTLKARYPDKIFLIRGNHESREINKIYGFYDECMSKFGNADTWKNFCLAISNVFP